VTTTTQLQLMIRRAVPVFLVSAGLVAATGCASAPEQAHWGYDGATGPAYWGEISPECAVCSDGREQSPVDIPAGTPVNAANIRFSYRPSELHLVNNGHTVQANYDGGSYISVEGERFDLLQFHFHALSEHTMGGEHADMEVHFVHQSGSGEYAVVGVMLNRGSENPAYEAVLGNLPAEAGAEATIDGVSVNAIDMLPADRSYYRYDGSFTTPPCTEGVKWFVLRTPVELSGAQVAAFEGLYDDNYRPVQPMYEREFHTRGSRHRR